ncbi:MAG: hypothetical protein D6725_10785 [Planctomycetota bacterium]|nr:MAG: hypothetical protein D6725_10785 [Planctomycetota bacterium]
MSKILPARPVVPDTRVCTVVAGTAPVTVAPVGCTMRPMLLVVGCVGNLVGRVRWSRNRRRNSFRVGRQKR